MTSPFQLTFLAFALLALSACVHSTTQPTAMPAKETAAMNTTSRDSPGEYHPCTPDEFPELTPEEVGRRFLKLIDSLKSFDELSEEHVRELTRLPMTSTPEANGEYFAIYLQDSGWRYSLTYINDPQSPQTKNTSFQFINEKSNLADMAPVCGLDYDAYTETLREMGFEYREGLDFYHHGGLPSLFDAFSFTRGDVKVTIYERSEAVTSVEKSSHACVKSIVVSRFIHG